MLMNSACFEHLFLPVCTSDECLIRTDARREYLPLVSIPLFNNTRIFCGIEHVKLFPWTGHADISIVGDLRCTCFRPPRGYDDDTVCTLCTINGHRRGIFQYGDILNGIRTQ